MPTNAALTLLHPSKSLESIATWISAAAAAVFPDFNSLRIKFASQSCIIAFDSRDDCRATETACRDKKIAGRQVGCSSTTSEEYSGLLQEILPGRNKGKAAPDRDGLQIKLFNLPYSITEEELKKVFPRCRRIFFAKNKSGTSCGIAILTFKKRLICEAALKRAKHLTLHGRRIRAEVNVSLAKTEPGESVGLKTRTKKARTTPNQVSHPKRQPTNPHSPPPEDVVKLNVAEDCNATEDVDGWT
uniref:RRM domain-containing protein n=1 Tax=Mesocestoides corti TaxID=53468 RepID=A0A5K3EQL2_MESCO